MVGWNTAKSYADAKAVAVVAITAVTHADVGPIWISEVKVAAHAEHVNMTPGNLKNDDAKADKKLFCLAEFFKTKPRMNAATT